jgi:simple sugar transport system ATP-binding protein
MDGALVRIENIFKTYGSIHALEDVSMTVAEREILGLVGDNGAGKSTLCKILSGIIQPDSGNMYFRGKKVRVRNTRHAIDLGIETIYQDSALVADLSISRNLFLGREPVLKGSGFLRVLDKRYMRRTSEELLRQVGLQRKLNPDAVVAGLSGGERQSIAIARAMFFKSDLILLDEPTNNLGIEEIKQVLRFIREAKEEGFSSVFITHNIHHVFQVADRIVVLRRGKLVGDVEKAETTISEVEELITGTLDIKFTNNGN